jgi:hypothetical protein
LNDTQLKEKAAHLQPEISACGEGKKLRRWARSIVEEFQYAGRIGRDPKTRQTEGEKALAAEDIGLDGGIGGSGGCIGFDHLESRIANRL